MKVKIKWVKEHELIKKGGCCPTKSMVDKSKLPPKKYVELDSLLEFMRWTNRRMNVDEYVNKEAVDEFVCVIEGDLKEEASPELLEWI